MARYKKQTLKMRADHTWTAPKGFNILALDRGAVRFAIPQQWIVKPDAESGEIRIHDREPPADDHRLSVSFITLNMNLGVDWSALPLRELLQSANEGDARPIHTLGDIQEERRRGAEIVWREMRFVDPTERREARSRMAILRRPPIQAVLTYEFWDGHLSQAAPIWRTALDTMVLGDSIADPRKGPQVRGE